MAQNTAYQGGGVHGSACPDLSELAHSSSSDGILFGDNCERRVFFPTNYSSAGISAIGEYCGVLSAATPDPLSALRLLAPSPYDVLKRAALLELNQASRGRRLKFPEQQPQQGATQDFANHPDAEVFGSKINNNPVSPKRRRCRQRRQNEPETRTVHGGGAHDNNTGIPPPLQESSPHRRATVAEIYSPHCLQRSTSSRVDRERRDACNTTADAINSTFSHHGHDEDWSVAVLLDTLRADEARTIREATRLRREADPSLLIRRFLRNSGLPLDHILATAARVYRRSRLQPCFSFWHTTALAESARVYRRSTAAIAIQCVLRVCIARRKATDRRKTRGTTARNACIVIQRAFRACAARRAAQARVNVMQRSAEKLARQRESERAELARREIDACTTIQATWRGLVGRDKGGVRARRKLQECLVDLGGGLGRMHRMYDCGVLAGCLEHAALARACEVALRVPFRSRGQSHEVLALLSRCRLLLRARQELREDMGFRWAREAKAHAAAESELARREKTHKLRQGLSQIEQSATDAKIAQSRAWEVWSKETDRRLRELHERQRLHTDYMEEERRRRSERYLMWREETRQRDVASKRNAVQEKRESRERVIMRHEELLVRKAWTLEDSRVGHARELREHGKRIYRLFRDSLPYETRDGSSKGSPETTSPSADGKTSGPGAKAIIIGDTEKPEVVIVDALPCVVDSRAVVITVALRPSSASLLTFQQAAAVRETTRDHDDARRQVAHWGGRCRVDAEATVRVRREQFRLRCKTKWERRRKAEEVSNAKAAAASSIVQLRMALGCARRATVARAMALAKACRVEPPRALLARKVPNEHCEKLMGRGDIDAYIEVQSGATAMQPAQPAQPAAAWRIVRRQAADGNVFTTSRNLPPASQLAECTSGTSNTPSTIYSTSPWTVADVDAHGRRAPVTAVEEQRSPDVAGKGWNREWSRSVDAWCRKTSARFREKYAEEAVRSARRLRWLARGGSGGESVRGDRKRGCDVGREGWAALAEFGDVSDLLELMGSTGELLISVEQREGVAFGGDEDGLNQTEICRNRKATHSLSAGVKDPPLIISKQEGVRLFDDASAKAAMLERPGGSAESNHGFYTDDETQGMVIADVGGTTASADTSVHRLDAAAEPSRNSSEHGVATGSAAGRVSGSSRRRRVPSPSKLVSVTEAESDSDAYQSNDEDDHRDTDKPDTVAHKENFLYKAMVEGDHADEGGGRDGCFADTAAAATTHSLQATRTACITLAPASVKSALGVPPLSLFVLQVARRQTQSQTTKPPVSNSGCDSSVSAAVEKKSSRGLPTSMLNRTVPCRFGGVHTNAAGHGKTGNSSKYDRGKKITPPGRSCTSTAGASVGLNSYTSTPQKKLLDAESGSGMARFLLQKEKQGIATAVQTLILPRLRISSLTANAKRAGVGKQTASLRLRLTLELPDDRKAQVRENGVKSKPAVDSKMKAVRPALPEMGKALASNSTATVSVDAVNATRRFLQAPLHRWVGRVDGRRCLLSCPAVRLNNSAFSVAGQRTGVGRISEGALATDEYAARDCSTTTRDEAAGLVNTSSAASSLLVEKLKARGSALLVDTALASSADPEANSCRGGHGHARRVQAIFVGGCLDVPPTPQLRQERYRVVGVRPSMVSSTIFWAAMPSETFWEKASLGFALDNPLCRNCGRHALRRFKDDATDLLLVRPPPQRSPSLWPEKSLQIPLRHSAGGASSHEQNDEKPQLTESEQRAEHGNDFAAKNVMGGVGKATKKRSSRAVYGDERRRTAPEFSRRLGEENNDCVGEIAGGQLADWVFRSGKVLCSRCLQALRSCEVPLHRVSCTISDL